MLRLVVEQQSRDVVTDRKFAHVQILNDCSAECKFLNVNSLGVSSGTFVSVGRKRRSDSTDGESGSPRKRLFTELAEVRSIFLVLCLSLA